MNLYIIDGNSYVYRAFYAIKGLTNSRGLPTNATYGFTNMLLKVIRERSPDGIVVSFDSPAPTERHRMFDAYKAHRPETPDELVQQLPYIRRVLNALRIRIIELPGYEADDILCTIAKKAGKEGVQVFIVTADKDMLQVVGDSIRIYDPVKNRVLDETYVKEKYGIGPERIPEFMAFTGDAVDNIPGVKGIGEKTAVELLAGCTDIEEILNHPERIKKEKVRNLVADNTEIVRMSRRLATVNTDIQLDVDNNEYAVQPPDWQELLSLFRELEFTSLMGLIPSSKEEMEFETVSSPARLREITADLSSGFAFQLVTGKEGHFREGIIGLALSCEKGKAWYIPFGHGDLEIDRAEGLRLLKDLYEAHDIAKIGHNLKRSVNLLGDKGISMDGPLYDIMLASYLLNPNKQNHLLEDIAFEYLSYRRGKHGEVPNNRRSPAEIPLSDFASFAAEDAALLLELKESLFEKIEREGLERLYSEIELPLTRVLAGMERAGFKVDSEKLNDMSKELSIELEAIQRRIYFIAGEEFNINSPKQLGRVLFQSLGLKPGKRTKTGFSTELSVLEELAEGHELPREILNYRSLSKLKSTYTDVLPHLINTKTGRIHTTFNQAATATGRLSSSEPNLQNIPVRGEWGRRIRGAFIAEEGSLILSADYSQIELRILAHLSGDTGLINAFKGGMDIHTRTASDIFGVPPAHVTPEMRRAAKSVNFGIVYGISPFGLSEALAISKEEAKGYIDGYFNRHPGVKAYIEETLRDSREKGFSLTLFGRKRAIPELKSANATTRSLGERLAINSPIQGTAADIIKIAMIDIWKTLGATGMKSRMILQVHDELIFETPEDELSGMERIVKETMESAANLSVSLEVEIGHGMNWAEAHG
jgi:DNA polymerase-1